ncbi:hypothetical protein D6D01_05762 [Aureobasidium pullulans]|uniref:Uncharacterized protein n=1 Tax=Aureobasidium pullulans TaxID=5580 RepID=A0A4S9L541_AURPU|nr:hypothetical protein D6D01_05762 [Aureobasidium pullulans]
MATGIKSSAFDFRSPLVGFLDASPGQIDAPVDIYVVTNHEGVPYEDGQTKSAGRFAPEDQRRKIRALRHAENVHT